MVPLPTQPLSPPLFAHGYFAHTQLCLPVGLEVLGVWELACNLEDYLYLHFPEDFEVQIKVLWFLPLVTESTLHAYQSNVVLKGSLKQITVAFEATWQNGPPDTRRLPGAQLVVTLHHHHSKPSGNSLALWPLSPLLGTPLPFRVSG